jgi:Flp pilus assembly protein TadB
MLSEIRLKERGPSSNLPERRGLSVRRTGLARRKGYMRLIADFIFLVLFLVFLVGWLLAWVAFHVTAGGIHILLAIAVIWLLVHLFRGRRTV